MSGYTKGPWHYDPRAVQNVWATGRGWIAAVGSSGMFGANAGVKADEANAHLIAASPDTYEALKEARDTFALTVGDRGGIIGKIDRALSKAEGAGQ